MDEGSISISRFERAGFNTAALVICGGAFLIGFAPRNERALFVSDTGRVPPKAFTAVVPPLDSARVQLENSLLTNASAGGGGAAGRQPGVRPGAAPRTLAAVDPRLLPNTLPTLLAGGDGAPAADGATPGGAAPAPTGGQQTPGKPPATPPTAPGLPVTTAGAPASVLPEPSTWAMMLLGFFAIGGTVRRRRSASTEVEALA